MQTNLSLPPAGTEFQIKQLQLLLNAHLPKQQQLLIDGKLSEKTRSALLSFQNRRRLATTGQLDKPTRIALQLKPVSTGYTQELLAPGRPWFSVAQAELGVSEILTPGRHEQRIVEYHQTTTLKANDDETPWCSSFVNWVFAQVGIRGTKSAAAKSWITWGVEDPNPSKGTVVVIKKKGGGPDRVSGSASGYHVGFLVGLTSGSVRLLGGNQDDKVGILGYKLSSHDVLAYRLPSDPVAATLRKPLI